MTAPDPARFNLAAHVLAAGLSRPDHPALLVLGEGGESWTHARLRAAVRGTAGGLLATGLGPGDRVLMRLANTPDFPILYLGAIWAGLVPVPTSAQLTAPEATRIAAEVAPALVALAEGVAAPDHAAPRVDTATLARWREGDGPEPETGDAERPAYLIYTSGTSGRPRGVIHAHRAILGRLPMVEGWTGLAPGDRLLHAGAFNWTYTLGTGLLDPWTQGATALIPAPGTDPAALPGLLAENGATIFAAAPGVYRRLLRADLPALPALRHGLSAGEKLAESLRARWRAATGTELHEAYGMSECSTFVSGSPARPAPPGSLGYPQPGRRVALLADAGEAPEGTPGVIAVHRSDPGLMLGYLGQPGETAARYRGDWFLTGDIGARDPDGALRYLGRDDDMMNAGGVRVSPIEVEEALCLHPGIAEAAAAEVRVGPETSVIAAFWSGPAAIPEAELAAHAEGRLAAYKRPRAWVRLDALPKGANGKILRRRLREDWETHHGQD